MASNTPQSTIKRFSILLACFLSACATESNTPATVHTNQIIQTTFNIKSKEIDANINGVKYFGFYIFNSCKDVMKQSTCAVGEAPKSTNIANTTQKLLQDLLVVAGTLDADGNVNANSPGLVAMRKRLAALDVAEKSIEAANQKRNDNIFSAIGEGRFTEFMHNKFVDTPDKDLRKAQEAMDESQYYANNLDYYNDRVNLVSVGMAQIDYATSKLNTVDATQTKLFILLPLLAQASRTKISNVHDYVIDESANNSRDAQLIVYAAETRPVTINTNFGDLVECKIYMGSAIRQVGACVRSNGDTYIISSHSRPSSH